MLLKLIVFLMLSLWLMQSADTARPKTDENGPEGVSEAAKETPADGLWPSRKLVRLVVQRWCADIGDEYELDEAQRGRYRDAEVQRWSEFLTRHRAEIQPVVNEFIEMRMELEPPPKQRVQAWAQRAMPVFDKLREKVTQATDEFRETLTPRQRAKFERDVLKLGLGLQLAESRLKQWRTGEYERDEFWQPRRAERRKRRAQWRKRRAVEAGDTTASKASETELDQISREVTAWEKYVEEFIRTYTLDEGQRDAARSVLGELRVRALGHRDRRREDIARLERRIRRHTGSEKELTEIRKRLVELYGPIDEMFSELRRRIEQIPTARQKENVKQHGRSEPHPDGAAGAVEP